MPEMIKEANLKTPTSRRRLRRGRQPHLNELSKGRALGYRRKPNDAAGSWHLRVHVGGKTYRIEPLGLADDAEEADGKKVLSYEQARAVAEKKVKSGSERAQIGGLTVRQGMRNYFDFLRADHRDTYDAERRAAKHILPKILLRRPRSPARQWVRRNAIRKKTTTRRRPGGARPLRIVF
jgi:hypothetical protein